MWTWAPVATPALRAAERQERNAVRSQVLHQRAPLGGVGVDGDVERVAMIEAQAIVTAVWPSALTGSGRWKRVGEEALERRHRASDQRLRPS